MTPPPARARDRLTLATLLSAPARARDLLADDADQLLEREGAGVGAAPDGEEGRGYLRKASASRMQILNRGFLNGTSHTIRKDRELRELKRLST